MADGDLGINQGVKNALCLQSFGCIANQVIAKGVEKRMREKYPGLNLLYLDLDEGVSEVNYYNCMCFFINHTRSMGAD